MGTTDTLEKGAKTRQFLSWTEFCNKVAVEMVLTSQGLMYLGNLTNVEAESDPKKACSPFYSQMRKAYVIMRASHEAGSKDLG